MKKLFILLLIVSSCSKPEPLKPDAPDYTSGKYRIEIVSESAIIAYSVLGEQSAFSSQPIEVEGLQVIQLTTLKGDNINIVAFSSFYMVTTVYRNDTAIQHSEQKDVHFNLTAY